MKMDIIYGKPPVVYLPLHKEVNNMKKKRVKKIIIYPQCDCDSNF